VHPVEVADGDDGAPQVGRHVAGLAPHGHG
jgi:hypothetical protein